MKKIFLSFVLIMPVFWGCNGDNPGQTAANSKPGDTGSVILEKIEWTQTWVDDTGTDSLARLLLIGDSHVAQYYGYVKKELRGKFVLGRYAGSKCLGNPFLEEDIRLFLRQYPCDVIVFNNGLHGKNYPDSVYAAHIPVVFDIFKKYAPHAKVIWVNTTPVRKKGELDKFAPFNMHVIMRNKLAREYMEKHGIPIVYSYSLGVEHPEYYNAGGVHFNAEGKTAEAHGIAVTVLKVTGKR